MDRLLTETERETFGLHTHKVKQIIRLSGKSRQVWKLWELFVQKYGKKTLGELANEPKKPELDVSTT